jgi:hypothetical protein
MPVTVELDKNGATVTRIEGIRGLFRDVMFITAMDVKNRTISLTWGEGFAVAPDAQTFVNSKERKSADLKAGMPVAWHFVGKPGRVGALAPQGIQVVTRIDAFGLQVQSVVQKSTPRCCASPSSCRGQNWLQIWRWTRKLQSLLDRVGDQAGVGGGLVLEPADFKLERIHNGRSAARNRATAPKRGVNARDCR